MKTESSPSHRWKLVPLVSLSLVVAAGCAATPRVMPVVCTGNDINVCTHENDRQTAVYSSPNEPPPRAATRDTKHTRERTVSTREARIQRK